MDLILHVSKQVEECSRNREEAFPISWSFSEWPAQPRAQRLPWDPCWWVRWGPLTSDKGPERGTVSPQGSCMRRWGLAVSGQAQGTAGLGEQLWVAAHGLAVPLKSPLVLPAAPRVLGVCEHLLRASQRLPSVLPGILACPPGRGDPIWGGTVALPGPCQEMQDKGP